MNTARPEELKPIRLVFELARAENPRLYNELVLFAKGAKRVNRLRVLAYDGLLAQYGAFGVIAGVSASPTSVYGAVEGAADLTNAVFSPGLAE